MNKPIQYIKFDGVKNAWVNERYVPNSELDLHLEEISRNGFTILENKLSREEINYAINKVDEVYELQTQDIGRKKN